MIISPCSNAHPKKDQMPEGSGEGDG